MYADALIDGFYTKVYPWALSEEASGNNVLKGMIATYRNWVVVQTEHLALHTRSRAGVQECTSYPNKEERTKGMNLRNRYVVLFHNHYQNACFLNKFYFSGLCAVSIGPEED